MNVMNEQYSYLTRMLTTSLAAPKRRRLETQRKSSESVHDHQQLLPEPVLSPALRERVLSCLTRPVLGMSTAENTTLLNEHVTSDSLKTCAPDETLFINMPGAAELCRGPDSGA